MNKMQLEQVRKYDEKSAKKAEKLIEQGFETSASLIIKQAMIKIAVEKMGWQNQTDLTANELWLAIQSKVESQKGMPLPISGAQEEIGRFQGKTVSLYYRIDKRIALCDSWGHTSAPIIHWNNDANHISSARAGKWMLMAEAERNFEAFVSPKPVAPRKVGHRVFAR